MIKTLTGLTMAAAVAFMVGEALAQQAGGGPQPQLGTSTPNAQNATLRIERTRCAGVAAPPPGKSR